MRRLNLFATAVGALVVLGAVQAPALAQGYGYGDPYRRGGDYDRRGPAPDDDFDRPRRSRDYDAPRRRDFEPEGRPRGGGGGVPQARGGFIQSCTDIRQEGFYLEASCRRPGGGVTRSRIDIRSCRSIGNNNGRLGCE